MPLVDFDIGEMYSGKGSQAYSYLHICLPFFLGNIPIGKNESETLFFIFQPTIGKPVDEVTIW
jgi:carboxypeptidase D